MYKKCPSFWRFFSSKNLKCFNNRWNDSVTSSWYYWIKDHECLLVQIWILLCFIIQSFQRFLVDDYSMIDRSKKLFILSEQCEALTLWFYDRACTQWCCSNVKLVDRACCYDTVSVCARMIYLLLRAII